jgi:hypothetical protein
MICFLAKVWYNLHIAEYHRTSTREEASVSIFGRVAIDLYPALPAKATKLELEALFDAREPTLFVRHHIHHTLLHAGSDRLYGDAPDEFFDATTRVTRLWSASGH